MLTLVLFEHHLITEVAAPGSFTAANVAVADDLPPPMPLHHHLELPHARGFPFCHFPVAHSPSFILVAAASPLARAPVSICVSLSLSLLTWLDTSFPCHLSLPTLAHAAADVAKPARPDATLAKPPDETTGGGTLSGFETLGGQRADFFSRGSHVRTLILEGVEWTSSNLLL